jgi:secreted trypsin-like serine protease
VASQSIRVAALGFVSVLTTSCVDAGATDSRDQSIIGGALVQSSAYPSVVALENGPGNWFCTATLIHERFVLTAAHCVEGETAATIKIRLDDTDINDTSGGSEVEVVAVHGHPGYDGVAWDNDIAIIELKTAATGHAITPVHRAVLGTGSSVTQVGYGDADDAGGGAGLLRAVTVPTIDCAAVGDPTVSGTNIVCFDGRTGHTTCYGDSGGPSFVMTATGLEVAAITSGGTADLCTGGFDLQTSVPGEIDFVDMYVPRGGPTVDAGADGGIDAGSDDGGCCSTGSRRDGSGGLVLIAAVALWRRRRTA